MAADDNDGLPQELAGYLDAFGAGRYWQAHEVLEGLWWARDSDPFLQGLILLAAAHHKLRSGGLEGARRHFLAAARYLEGFPPRYGFDVSAIVAHARHAAERIEGGQKPSGSDEAARLCAELAPPQLRVAAGGAAAVEPDDAMAMPLAEAVRHAVQARAASGLPTGEASWGALVKEVALLTRGTFTRGAVREAVRSALAERGAGPSRGVGDSR